MAERQKGYFVGFGFGERRSVLASTRPSKQDVWIALPQAVCAMAGKEGTMASLQMGQRDEDSPTAWGGRWCTCRRRRRGARGERFVDIL